MLEAGDCGRMNDRGILQDLTSASVGQSPHRRPSTHGRIWSSILHYSGNCSPKRLELAGGDDLILQSSIPVDRENRRVGKNRLVTARQNIEKASVFAL
jgi:hypothetical protein